MNFISDYFPISTNPPPIVSIPKSIDSDSLLQSLNKTIAGQDNAKKQIADVFALHLTRQQLGAAGTPGIKQQPCNMLLVGPTGSGKTSIVKALAQAAGFHLLTIDASRLVNEGFIGTGLSTYLKELEGKDPKKVIVFFDEIDKLFTNQCVNNDKVQAQLLQMLEGNPYYFGVGGNGKLSTNHMTFILGGTFGDLQQGEKGGGEISTERLAQFGLSSELLGRLTDIIQLEPLTSEQYHQVLALEEGNISLRKWEREFAAAEAKLDLDQKVIDIIVEQAVNEKLGVRGLDLLLRQLLNHKLSEAFRNKTFHEQLVIQVGIEEWDATNFAKTLAKRKSFPTLEEIKAALDRHVIGQEKAKKEIAEIIYYHRWRLNSDIPLPKRNALMMGPSGSGKTFMMEVLSEKLKIPLAILDASKLTIEGATSGNKIENALIQLLEQTNGDIKLVERGIIFLDEIDKQFEDALKNSSASGISIQNQLLRVLQGDKIQVKYKGKNVTINTENILFIIGGAFSKFPQLYNVKEVDHALLLKCGIRPEFLGRIASFVQLNQPTEKDLRTYLNRTDADAPLLPWRKVFETQEKKWPLDETKIKEFIKRNLHNGLGIRGFNNDILNFLVPKALTKG